MVNNTGTELARLTLRTLLYDKQGKVVGRKETPFMVEGENSVTIEHELLSIASPHLWTPESPYLYNALNQLVGSDGEVLDENVNPVGFRWFHFDAETGFHLNGNPCKLIGSSRHQDYKFKANALVDDHAVRDVELLKKMGGNFLRIAHYPQDKAVIQACDRLGILCAIEIPLVNEITETKEFVKIASICLWKCFANTTTTLHWLSGAT